MKNLEEHSNWTVEELREFLSTLTNFRTVSTNLKFMKENILQKTGFLDGYYQKKIPFSTRVYTLINGYQCVDDIPRCKICGNNPVLFLKHDGTFSDNCSKKCATTATLQKSKEVFIEKYGVEHQSQIPEVKEKIKRTFVEKYGVEHQSQIPGVQNRRMATNMNKYGATSPSSNPDVMAKTIETNMREYGVPFTGMAESVKAKSKKTVQHKYGVDYYTQTEEIREARRIAAEEKFSREHHMQRHFSDDTMKILDSPELLAELYGEFGGIKTAKMLGVWDCVVYDRLRKYDIPINNPAQSAAERQLTSFIRDELGIPVIEGDRGVLGGKEIDILVNNIGIEFNGLHWHSSRYVDKNYHLDKTVAAEKVGVRLIHIFEDEWELRKEQVKAKLRSVFGADNRDIVYARNTRVGDVSKREAVGFLNTNHIQGAAGATYRIGLYQDETLVALMQFKKRSDGEYELNRYATSLRVVGGFSKLLSHSKAYLSSMGCMRIVSFSDKRWSDGNMYRTTGWTHEYDTAPDYQYVVGNTRVRKQRFRRKYLERVLKNFDPSLSEVANTYNHGVYQIFDCGLSKFVLEL